MIDKDEVRRLRGLGLSYRHIGQAVGCSYERVRQILEVPEETEKRLERMAQLRRQHMLLAILRKRAAEGKVPTVKMMERIHREVELDPKFGPKVDEVLR